jgi:NAD+ kinase
MKKVHIIPNPSKDTGFRVTARLIETLLAQGFRVSCRPDLRDALGHPPGVDWIADGEAWPLCDFVAVVGGDGSILQVAADAARFGRPVLGVNVGTIGFMTELEPSELGLAAGIRAGDFALDDRMTLTVSVANPAGETTYTAGALNEITVTKGIESKTIRLQVRVDGQDTVGFSGDGLIVATPTGSTAYSLAAGGPILAPAMRCIAVTPLCPFSLTVKSFVVDAASEIVILPTHDGRRIYLSPDGFEAHLLSPGDTVRVTCGAHTFSLIRLKGMSFYQRISMKLSK